jgi:glycosyltransferase involved in cell wall biosynthesis
VLEAMAMERAIVSTRLGAEGIPCKDGEHILLADTPADFSDKVLRLIGDKVLRSRIEKQAGEWVRKYYDWNILCEEIPVQLNRVLLSTNNHQS